MVAPRPLALVPQVGYEKSSPLDDVFGRIDLFAKFEIEFFIFRRFTTCYNFFGRLNNYCIFFQTWSSCWPCSWYPRVRWRPLPVGGSGAGRRPIAAAHRLPGGGRRPPTGADAQPRHVCSQLLELKTWPFWEPFWRLFDVDIFWAFWAQQKSSTRKNRTGEMVQWSGNGSVRFLFFCILSVSSELAPTCDDATLLQKRKMEPAASTTSSLASSLASSFSTSVPFTSTTPFSSGSTTTSVHGEDFRPPNAEIRATYGGLNFALAQSKEFVAMKIIEAPLIPGGNKN